MGVAYAEVEYEIGGFRYRTIHGLASDANETPNSFTPVDTNVWGVDLVGDAVFADATDPSDLTVQPRTVIEAILYFHRKMQSPAVILRNLSINDGPTPGDATGNFVSLNLDLQCRGNIAVNSNTLGGLNNTMLITKQPDGFSKRKGRMFLRGAIAHTHMIFGDRDGVTFQPGFRAAYSLHLSDAIGQGGTPDPNLLYTYFGGKPGPGPMDFNAFYVIPNTKVIAGIDPDDGTPIEKRILFGYTNINLMEVTDVQSRDTRRKKKSK